MEHIGAKHSESQSGRARADQGSLTWSDSSFLLKKSLVVQWLKTHLAMQVTPVQSLVQEDPTCCGADRLLRHNY